MRNELKLLISSVFILVFTTFINAADDLNVSQSEVKIESKVLYTKYVDIPKVVYTKQQFNVTIQANILISYANIPYTIFTKFDNSKSNLELLTQDIVWNNINDNLYETTLKFKVLKDSVLLPSIEIHLLDDENELIDKSKIKNEKIIFQKIAINQKLYSNVIAQDLVINSIKTKQYTNTELIHMLAITGTASNLEEFYISKYENQEVKVLDSNGDTQIMYYSIRTPRGEKSIHFSYYNTLEHRFINKRVIISIQEDLVSTQTDLNPYENDMMIYKRLAVAMVVLCFLMIYYFKREIFYLFFTVVFMTLLIYMMYPNDKMVLENNTKVYILPTPNSTIFSILNKNEEVEILIDNGKYKKVLFKNKNIGWIKHG